MEEKDCTMRTPQEINSELFKVKHESYVYDHPFVVQALEKAREQQKTWIKLLRAELKKAIIATGTNKKGLTL